MKRTSFDTTQPTLPFPESQNVWETKGIFSDHYVRTRLKGSRLWPKDEEVKLIWEFCSNLWSKKCIALGKGNEEFTKQEFLEPILDKLGFAYSRGIGAPSGGTPDYLLFADEETKESVYDKDKATQYSAAISLLEAKKVHHPLGTASKQETPGRFPHHQIKDYLQEALDDSDKPYFRWAILTNGDIWRLYCRDTRPSSYFEFNLEMGIASFKDFAVFVALFQRSAFIKDFEGKCPLDYLREEALECQAVLEADLRKRVFKILVDLANGFYRRTENKIEDLDKLYENCLIFLYRLLFILYAEGRRLLPVKPYRTAGARAIYRDRYSLQHLFPKLKNCLNFPSDEFTDLYEDMLKLFHLINNGNKVCDVPQYNGGLFDPTKYHLLEEWRIGERTLANVLRRLVSANIPKGIGEQESFDFGNTVDYADLEVRQLGSIYEGLLENHLELEPCHPELVSGTELLVLRGDKTERKATGTYYTPDYIVQYIVENTLDLLCEEIEKLPEVQNARQKGIQDNSFAREVLKLNILDPAMGSGHFLVRAVEFLADQIVYHSTTVLQIKEATRGLSQDEEVFAYWRRRVVENCIYGVDLNPLAVELAKLSLWLTCIAGDQPLSFLDHHLRPGNSLIGAKLKELGNIPKKKETKQIPLFAPDLKKAVSFAIQKLRLIEETESKDVDIIKDKEKYWQEVRNNLKPYREVADLWTSTFFGTKINETEYQSLANLISNPKPRTKVGATLAVARIEGQGQALPLQKKLAPYIGFHEVAENKMFFHWELEFPEVFFNDDGTPKQNPGFDAVIGNPPYVRQEQIKEFKPAFQKYFNCYTGIADLYVYFYEQAYNVLREAGIFGFISSNKFMRAGYGEKLRDFLSQKTILRQIIDFNGSRVFPSTVDTCIVLFSKEYNEKNSFSAVLAKQDLVTPKQIEDYIKEKATIISQNNLGKREWSLQEERILKLKQKIEKAGIPLKQWEGIKINRGITTGLNEVFIIDGKTKEELVSKDKKSLEILKPILRGKDIKKWHYEFKNFYLIYSYTGIDIKRYPAIYDYLNGHKEKLEQVWEAKYGKKQWYELRGCGYYEEFEKSKIIWSELNTENSFVFDKHSHFILDTGYILTGNNLKFLLALFNSSLHNFYFRQISSVIGQKGYRYKYEYIEQLPIKRASDEVQKELTNLVDQILSIYKQYGSPLPVEAEARVKEIERHIDQIVYKFYGLTDGEIALIEGNAK